jgi:glucose/mannose-6-phosphate isomerase
MKEQKDVFTDRSGVHNEYRRWPELASLGAEIEISTEFKDVTRIIVAGVGGSAAAGDIVAGWASSFGNAEVLVFKGNIPVRDMSKTLVIACSASGNTKETIGMASYSIRNGAKVILMSSGGILFEKSKDWRVEHLRIPSTIAPRYVLPFNVMAIVRIVSNVFGIRVRSEIQDTLFWMGKVKEEIVPEVNERKNRSRAIARLIFKRIPKIYGSRITRGVAVRFKNSLNENAKMHACSETIPELFHNEVESWEMKSSLFIPFILRHSMETNEENRRINRLIEKLEEVTNPVQIRGNGNTSLSELMTMTYILDFASYYTALLLGVDPLPTRLIDSMRI